MEAICEETFLSFTFSLRFPLLELDDAAETLLVLPFFFFSTLLSLALGVADTYLGLEDLLPLLLRLLELPRALLIDLDLEPALTDLEVLRDRDEPDLGDGIGLPDLRDSREDARDLERDERLPGLSIM